MIEPTVKAMLEEYLYDWQGIESLVRGMVLNHLGAFDGYQMFLLDFDEKPREGLAKFLDLNIYDDFKKSYPRFPHRIQYLRKHGLIGDNLYKLLEDLNDRRNKIHRYKTGFPENLRVAFNYAYSWLHYLQMFSKDSGFNEDYKARMRESIEKSAEHLLDKLRTEESTAY